MQEHLLGYNTVKHLIFAASKFGDFKRLKDWRSLILAVSQFMFSILIGLLLKENSFL